MTRRTFNNHQCIRELENTNVEAEGVIIDLTNETD
jgi:hypothetical protein